MRGSHFLKPSRSFRSFIAARAVGLLFLVPLLLGLAAPGRLSSAAQQPTGKLYVVDSNRTDVTSSVFVVDPQKGEITRTYSAGFHPDIALSEDGGRLYVAYDSVSSDMSRQTGVLDVIDTASGKLIARVDNPDRWEAIGELYDSNMALSKDGRWLFVYKMTSDGASYGFGVFDTTTNKFLPDKVSLPGCEAAQLFPSRRNPNTVFVVCEGTTDIRTVRLAPNGKPVANDIQRGIRFSRGGIVGTVFPSDEDRLRVVMRNGEFSTLDLATRSSVGRGVLAIAPGGRPNTPGQDERHIRFSGVAADKVFLGIARRGVNHLFDEIAIVNADTLERTATLQAAAPLWAFAIGDDGSRLYGVDPVHGSIHVFDTARAAETGVIRGVGKSPTIVIFSR